MTPKEHKGFTLKEIMEEHRCGSYQEMLDRVKRAGNPIILAKVLPGDIAWAKHQLENLR